MNFFFDLAFFTFFFVDTENSFFNDEFVHDLEIFESYTWDWTSNSGSDVVADITNEIRYTEKFFSFIFVFLVNNKSPVITEFKFELSMIWGFDYDFISHESWT